MSITYDANGNPLSYYNGQNYTFTWENGRQLASAVIGNNTITYAYDVNGQRISKTVNGTTHNYTYDGLMLLCDSWGSQYIEYFYDASGSPYALNYYNGSTSTKYYFVKNIEGDVLELRTGTNTLVARYIYDGWGKLLEVRDASGNAITSSTHIANLNGLRYRGYFYDTETKLYYLQSRYYDPQTQRFISPDSYVSTGRGIIGHNMFAYCSNCPASFSDVSGQRETFVTLGDSILWAFQLMGGGGMGFPFFAGVATLRYSSYVQTFDFLVQPTVNEVNFNGNDFIEPTSGQKNNKGPYSYLSDPEDVGPGKDFSKSQKSTIIQEKMNRNGGVVRSDLSGTALVRPEKNQKGIVPNPNEWQIDHIIPKRAGGTNSYSNVQVLSRYENRLKWFYFEQ